MSPSDSVPILVGGVFVVTFVLVCAVAYVVLRRWSADSSRPSTGHFSFGTRLPVSKRPFDFVSRQAAAAIATPEVSPETRGRLEGLGRLRRRFVAVYRVIMIAVGLIGLAGAAALFHTHTPGNMHGLPAAIILLLALGALLSGLVPGPSIAPDMEPIHRRLLDKIKVRVVTSEPRAISLTAADLERAAALVRQGRDISDAARAAYRDYDTLDEPEKRAMETMVAQAIENVSHGRRG